MSQKTTEVILKTLPDFFKNVLGYLKDNFSKNGQEIFENANGTVGIILKLFGQPIIDHYFKKLSEKKLDNFGLNIYLKCGILQAHDSLEKIKEKINNDVSVNVLFEVVKNSMERELIEFEKEDVIFIFQPKYHPAIKFIKNNFERILKDLKCNAADIKDFLKDFNDNIEAKIISEFANDYEEHINRVEKFLLKENETAFLIETIQQGKIGFKDGEDLKYEQTFAKWKKVHNLRGINDEEFLDDDQNPKEDDEEGKQIFPIESLIEQYFSRNSDNNLNEILFIIADFGKGKSVFMKHFAAKLAKEYLTVAEGYFPIYFNLRNYKNYSSESKLGVLSDYMETKFSIKIDDEYYQKKKFLFLIDSLDESGELNKRSIDKVISSIKNIQKIDKIKYKTNRIIITSRPFDEGLSHHLSDHNPFMVKNEQNRDIPCYLNIHGFTKPQFNDWLTEVLKPISNSSQLTNGFAKEIINAIKANNDIDVYKELLKNNTLSKSELQRPIFAYMIYQLIINDVDFLSVGKVGIYLSFLNLLTKEAKHIHDVNYKVNLKEEFEFRNILHATASLWMHERQKGKQGILKKADVCRVLDGKKSSETDDEILERVKGSGLSEIQFLSHSYFGENDNILHFQHQSFAEILLAEYYLKVFIKYALDDDADSEEAAIKLVLGEPTQQTVLFFKEILQLLRETVSNVISQEVLEKRRLLFPLMASLATKKHNKLFCNYLYYSWFLNCEIDENQTNYPLSSLENWCINQEMLNKIINLAATILNFKSTYLPLQANTESALFDNEVLVIDNQNLSNFPQNIDKWLSLLVGNVLYNNISNKRNPMLFNSENKSNPIILFEMIKNWNYTYLDSCPSWGKDLFMGLDMSDNSLELNLSHYNFDGINFSYSNLKNIYCWNTNWSRCELNYCIFDNVDFITSLFFETSIQNIKEIIQPFYMGNCRSSVRNFIILNALNTVNLESENSMRVLNVHTYVSSVDARRKIENLMKTISGFIEYGLKKSIFKIDDLKASINYEDADTKTKFEKELNKFLKFEKK